MPIISCVFSRLSFSYNNLRSLSGKVDPSGGESSYARSPAATMSPSTFPLNSLLFRLPLEAVTLSPSRDSETASKWYVSLSLKIGR